MTPTMEAKNLSSSAPQLLKMVRVKSTLAMLVLKWVQIVFLKREKSTSRGSISKLLMYSKEILNQKNRFSKNLNSFYSAEADPLEYLNNAAPFY